MPYRALLAIALLTCGAVSCIFNSDESRFFADDAATTGEERADAALSDTLAAVDSAADSATPQEDTAPDAPPVDTALADTEAPDTRPQDAAPPTDAAPEDAPPPEDTSQPDTRPPADTRPPQDTAAPPDTRPQDTAAPCTVATAYRDNDGDGQGDPSRTTTWCVEEGAPPEGYSPNPLDCDDNDPAMVAGSRRCSPDAAHVQICAEGTFRDIATCGFEQSCFATPDGAECGCDPSTRRCEDWQVRLCAPDRSSFLAYDCRPDQCDNANCPDCTVLFIFRDRDRDGDGDLTDYAAACAEDPLPDGFAATGTDCRDDDAAVQDGDLFCDDDGVTVRRCVEGRAARVQRCAGSCAVVGPGLANCQ